MHPTIRMALALCLLALVLLLAAGSAFAQNNRSAVSVNGSDANPCTVALPCRSFTAAIAVTNDGGEIVALDSAGYGPFTITTSVTVSGAPGVHAAITGAGGNGITINGAGIHVSIRDLVFIGNMVGAAIQEYTAADVYIEDCLSRDFSAGVDVEGGDATIERCVILGADAGILSQGSHQIVIEDTTIEDSTANGLEVLGHGRVSMVRSTIARVSTGIVVETTGGSGVNAIVNVKDSVIVGNTFGVGSTSISGNTASIYLSNCMINYNTTAVSVSGTGANVYTYSNNQFNHNTAAGDPMGIASFQ